ncbi:MAG: choice-of-anchor tandem repeat GloVer-containing protein [Verrucomicrobiota bacterium]
MLIPDPNPAQAGFPPRTLVSFGLDYAYGNVIQGKDGNLYGMADSGGDFGQGAVVKITPSGNFTLLTSFSSTAPFANPTSYGNLIQGIDGNFYGTGTSGGTNSDGALFSINPSGTVTLIASFGLSTGIQPGPLMQATDGNFYGVAPFGGTNGSGNVYQVTPAGSINILYSFSGGNDGGNPQSPLLQWTNGTFYGTTSGGGTNGGGTVFALTASGQFTSLASFGSNLYPCGSLAAGLDGNIYGTTSEGGASNLGIAFKVTPAGELAILADFTGNNGGNPQSGLVAAADGNFYGATSLGGRFDLGTLFRMSPEGIITTLHSFDGKDGAYPGNLVQGEDGNFYGTTFSTVFKMTSSGSFKTLVQPRGSGTTALIHATDGNLYGTTSVGGDFGGGTAYKYSPSGLFTMLDSFGETTNVGIVPGAAFLEGRNGEFYGTTTGGGAGYGGTIFRTTPAGRLTTLVSFNQNPMLAQNGSEPSSLIQGADGFFYGTTSMGGAPQGMPNYSDFGTVFKMTPKGVLTTLASFDGTNGANPRDLIRGHDGNYYGITMSMTVGAGSATVFKITPAGDLTTLFYFGGTNGNIPYNFLQGKDGNFYGTTGGNGSNIGATIFQLTPTGTLTNLAQFDATNGFYPAGLAEGPDGNLYCAMAFDGSTNLNQGAIFRITPSGNILRLAAFNGADGSNPVTLLPLPGGRLYGATYSGGRYGGGTLFALGAASFEGLFYEATNINPKSSGFFRLTVSPDLRFTGTFKINGRHHPISGAFDAASFSAPVTIRRDGLPKLTAHLQLSTTGDAITGSVSDGTWTAQLNGESNTNYDAAYPAPQTGAYSFTLSDSGNGISSPGNGSKGHVTVAADGAIALSGVLSDSSVIGQGAFVATEGQWPFYVSLYHGKGSLIGWMTFTNQPANGFNGTVVWSKVAGAGRPYPKGFTNAVAIEGLISSP